MALWRMEKYELRVLMGASDLKGEGHVCGLFFKNGGKR